MIMFFFQRSKPGVWLAMAVVPIQVNENFIKACRDGDLESFNQLVVQADVNYVSESGG